MKWILTAFLVVSILGAKLALGEPSVQNTNNAPQEAFSPDLGGFQAKDPILLALIDSLVACESGGRWNIRVLDTNGRYSYSGLQFQLDTFIRYNKVYKVLPDMEDGEALNAIYDEWTQRELAYHILKDGGHYNWRNCYDHQL